MFHRSASSSSLDQQSLAANYIPDKLSSSPAPYDGDEARRQSRLAAGGWGAAARNGRASFATTTSSTDRHAGASAGAGAGAFPRQRKRGAGRSAWGENGGGHAALGAGGYESDEGVELDDESHDQFTPSPTDENERLSHMDRPYGMNDKSTSTPGSGSTMHAHTAVRYQSPTTTANSRRGLLGIKAWRTKGRWNRFKWFLFVGNSLVTSYSIAGFVAIMLVWANYFPESKVLFTVNQTELVLGTIAICLCLITAVIGWAGILLNNRMFLAIYSLMLWVSFAFIVAPGYIAYKKRTFNLSGKMNRLWSQILNLPERRALQTELQCCGYYSPYIEAAADGTRCYSRAQLPGCKGPLVSFEQDALKYIYVSAFATVPAHLICLVTAMLCSNHITYRFGKGVTPAPYRVNESLLQSAYRKSAIDKHLTVTPDDQSTPQQHLLYADQVHDPPRPRFWQESRSVSASSSSKSKY